MSTVQRATSRCGVVAVFGLFALIGCSATISSTKDTSSPAATSSPGKPEEPYKPKDVLKDKPDVVISATDLNTEWKKDEKAFLGKYENKLLEVKGKAIGYDDKKLLVDEKGNRFICKDAKIKAKVLPGQTVVLRAVVDRSTGALWEIASVTGTPEPMVSAEDWVKALVADKEGTQKKYTDKDMTVTGTIVAIKKDPGVTIYLTDKEKDKVNVVYCDFADNSPDEKARNSKFKVGQKVKITGNSVLGDGQLLFCELVEISE